MPENTLLPTVDDVIVALQKSISRVTNQTGDHMDELRKTAEGDVEVSMLDGPVSWSLRCSVTVDDDKLRVVEQGPIQIELSGRVTVPFGLEEPEPAEEDQDG